MYRSRNGQQSFFDSARTFGGVKLDPDNDWVKLGEAIPWDEFEKEYAASFGGAAIGKPAKPARMALGALLIKKRYRFSDEDTVKEVQMNPYLQYFIGLVEFTHKAPFDASSLSNFRKRATPDMLSKMNKYIEWSKKRSNVNKAQPEAPLALCVAEETAKTTAGGTETAAGEAETAAREKEIAACGTDSAQSAKENIQTSLLDE